MWGRGWVYQYRSTNQYEEDSNWTYYPVQETREARIVYRNAIHNDANNNLHRVGRAHSITIHRRYPIYVSTRYRLGGGVTPPERDSLVERGALGTSRLDPGAVRDELLGLNGVERQLHR